MKTITNRLRFIWIAIVLSLLAPRDTAFAGSGSTDFGISIPNPFRAGDSLYTFIVTVINEIILPIGAVIVVIFIIYSGYMFVTGQGNPAQLQKAKDNFLWVIVGTAVLLGAWVIAQVVQNTINNLRA